jgi:hypothetical protein
VIHTRNDLRPVPTYPVYPPYHIGDYIEDFFYKKFIEESPTVARDYIALSWTTLYCQNQDPGIQNFLNSLDQSKSYFTVCQHDDAPRHSLPPDTLIFSLSQSHSNLKNLNPIPIPATCSSIPVPEEIPNKDIFASFVGSNTHQIRMDLYNLCRTQPNYYFSGQQWNPVIPQSKLNELTNIMIRSKFALCPRGYGNTSFRMYEAMQLGAVPVYISDDFFLPWSDELNWNEFCVIVDSKNLKDLPSILNSIPEEQINKMANKAKQVYSDYFTLDATYTNIVKRIK